MYSLCKLWFNVYRVVYSNPITIANVCTHCHGYDLFHILDQSKVAAVLAWRRLAVAGTSYKERTYTMFTPTRNPFVTGTSCCKFHTRRMGVLLQVECNQRDACDYTLYSGGLSHDFLPWVYPFPLSNKRKARFIRKHNVIYQSSAFWDHQTSCRKRRNSGWTKWGQNFMGYYMRYTCAIYSFMRIIVP